MKYIIIPDIHGQVDKLHELLNHLFWNKTPSGWRSPEPNQEIVFLGDFIDRGPNNAEVIKTVRSLVDAGKAHAVMGNHELNALHFHTTNPKTGLPLRSHSEKNIRQHKSFLSEFDPESPETADVISWMHGLPLYLEFDGFRAVHACWQEDTVQELSELTNGGVLSPDQLIQAADNENLLFELVETTTKGPEITLPDGFSFTDKDGTIRSNVRVQWWRSEASHWRDIAMSVPDNNLLPDCPLPSEIVSSVYPDDAKPVFFGHYWLTGTPIIQSRNALCLDYSAGRDGPLLAYCIDEELSHQVSLDNVQSAP
jgi:hypothetical protein